jgi:hypothetical protein
MTAIRIDQITTAYFRRPVLALGSLSAGASGFDGVGRSFEVVR